MASRKVGIPNDWLAVGLGAVRVGVTVTDRSAAGPNSRTGPVVAAQTSTSRPSTTATGSRATVVARAGRPFPVTLPTLVAEVGG